MRVHGGAARCAVVRLRPLARRTAMVARCGLSRESAVNSDRSRECRPRSAPDRPCGGRGKERGELGRREADASEVQWYAPFVSYGCARLLEGTLTLDGSRAMPLDCTMMT